MTDGPEGLEWTEFSEILTATRCAALLPPGHPLGVTHAQYVRARRMAATEREDPRWTGVDGRPPRRLWQHLVREIEQVRPDLAVAA